MAIAAPSRKRRQPAAPPPHARAIGKYERLYHERHERDLRLAYPQGRPRDPQETQHPQGLWYDEAAGQRVVDFIEGYCRHSKGEWAGQRIVLTADQRERWRRVFGWKRADGTRRFRIVYMEIARKNAKSTEAAAVGVYLTVADHEPGAEVYSSATKEEQAKIVWSAAEAMVKQSPPLKRWLRTYRKNISCERMGSKFEPLGADSDTLDGLNPHGNIVDETHAHKDRALWDVLQTAQGARRQPLTIAITTAGTYDPTSIGWELHEYAMKVLDGALEDDRFFAYIAAADEGDDYRDERSWEKANPNLDVSIKRDYLREQCEHAARQPSFLNTFLRLHLNQWTQQITRWISMEAWNSCNTTPGPMEGRVAYGGLDLSTKLDISALTLVLPSDDGFYDLLFRFWVPEELVEERARRHALPDYAAWVRDGHLMATPGNVIDYEFIRRDLLGLAGTLKLRELGFDPWNAQQLATQLSEQDGFTMVEMRQGVRTLSEPSKEFEKLIMAKKFRHGGHPVMRWMVSNVTIRRDANENIAPDKEHAAGKIDGVVSTIMGLGRALLHPARVRWQAL